MSPTITVENNRLTAADYSVLGISLAMSLGIGVYHDLQSRRKNRLQEITSKSDDLTDFSNVMTDGDSTAQTDEYLMGSRKMPTFPVALSLVATFISGILLLAVPAEIFERGLLFALSYPIAMLSGLVAAYVFLPLFYNLRLTSVFEYFEMRYKTVLVRRFCAIVFIFNTLVYLSVVIYAPSVALAHVIGIHIIGASTTLYTTIGGLKAVVWTDAMQAIFMYVGVLALTIRGVQQVGGMAKIFEIASESGRIDDLFRFDPNPLQYNNIWMSLIGWFVLWASVFGTNQLAIQRYSSLPTLSDARKALFWTMPGFLLLAMAAVTIGLIALADFYNCNPLETGEIASRDQLIIHFARKVLPDLLPGLFGLYLSCLLSASLSTLSSGINSISAVIFTDFIKPIVGKKLSPCQAMTINKSLVLIIGTIASSMAFAAGPLGGILRTIVNILGALAGPTFGLFTISMCLRKIGAKSAVIAFFVSSTTMIVICICNFIENPYEFNFLPTNTTVDGCGNQSFTLRYVGDGDYIRHYGLPTASILSRISFVVYPFIGFAIVFIVGMPLSWIFPDNSARDLSRLTLFCKRTDRVQPTNGSIQRKNSLKSSMKNRVHRVHYQDDVDDKKRNKDVVYNNNNSFGFRYPFGDRKF